MKSLLIIVAIIAISGCSTTDEKITITEIGSDRTDPVITEVLEEKIQ